MRSQRGKRERKRASTNEIGEIGGLRLQHCDVWGLGSRGFGEFGSFVVKTAGGVSAEIPDLKTSKPQARLVVELLEAPTKIWLNSGAGMKSDGKYWQAFSWRLCRHNEPLSTSAARTSERDSERDTRQLHSVSYQILSSTIQAPLLMAWSCFRRLGIAKDKLPSTHHHPASSRLGRSPCGVLAAIR